MTSQNTLFDTTFLPPMLARMIIIKIKRGRIIREINGIFLSINRDDYKDISNEIGRSRIGNILRIDLSRSITLRFGARSNSRKHRVSLRQSKRHRVLDIRSPSKPASAMFTLPAREPRGSLKY